MFDISQEIFDRDGLCDDRETAEYIDDLMEVFAASPEAQPVIANHGGVGYAAMMMDYAFNHLGTLIPKMKPRDFHEIVFDIFPRKVSTEPESAFPMIAELTAFWSFVQREYSLPNAAPILASITDGSVERLREALANPRNWGMAKSFVMQGNAAGFDMTTQEGYDQFMAVYNQNLLSGRVHVEDRLPFNQDSIQMLPPIIMSSEDRAKKRKARKAQRQARKRGRR